MSAAAVRQVAEHQDRLPVPQRRVPGPLRARGVHHGVRSTGDQKLLVKRFILLFFFPSETDRFGDQTVLIFHLTGMKRPA